MTNDQHFSPAAGWVGGSYMPFTATKLLQSGYTVLHGVLINSHSSGSFRFYNALTGVEASAIQGTFSPAAGSSVIILPQPIPLSTGLFVATGGTIDATAIAS